MSGIRRGFLWALVIVVQVSAGRAKPPPLAASKARVDQYGDALPANVRARMGCVRLRHGSQVMFLGYSPDGKWLASAGMDGSVYVWDTASHKEQYALQGRMFGPQSIAWVDNGKMLAVVGSDMTIQFHDVVARKIVRQFPGPSIGLQSLAIAADGKSLAFVGADQTAKVWDAVNGKEMFTLVGPPPPNGGQNHFYPQVTAFSGDGRFIALGGQDGRTTAVRVWDAAANVQVFQFNLPQHTGMQSLLFSPDGKQLLVKDGSQTLRLYELASGKELRSQNGRAQFGAISEAFSPAGTMLASVNGTQVHLEEPTGKAIRQFTTPHFGVTALAFSPDGQTLATGGLNNLITLWDVAKGTERMPPAGVGGAVASLTLSPRGNRLATCAADQSIRIWDLATGKEQRLFQRPVNPANGGELNFNAQARFSKNGKVLTAAWMDGLIQRWDTNDGKDLGQYPESQHDMNFTALTFAPDGNTIAFGLPDGSVRLRDAATGRLVRQIPVFKSGDVNSPYGNGAGIIMLAYARDGKALAVGGYEAVFLGPNQGVSQTPCIRLVELATGKERRQIRFKGGNAPEGGMEFFRNPMMGFIGGGMWMDMQGMMGGTGLASGTFAPGGRTMAINTGTSILLWDLARGRTVRSFGSLTYLPGSIAFAPDGSLVTAGTGDGMLTIWDTATGTLLAHAAGHRGPIHALVFSSDGKTLVSASSDTTVLSWDVPALLEAGRKQASMLSSHRLELLWKDLGEADSARADRAQWALTLAPEQAVALLKARLRPMPPIDETKLQRLIADLDHNQFAVRRQATAALEQMGAVAGPALRQALQEKQAPELRKRVQSLLEKLDRPVTSPDALLALRSVEVLERIATPEARTLLATLATGAPEAPLTRDASAALERLRMVRAAP